MSGWGKGQIDPQHLRKVLDHEGEFAFRQPQDGIQRSVFLLMIAGGVDGSLKGD